MNRDRIAEPRHLDEPEAPKAGEAHVWRVLLPGEDGRQAARQALREILGAYLELAPEAVALRLNATGKPELEAPAPVSFNLSHTAGLALIAIVPARLAVGVDVELVKPRRDPARLAARWLPAEDAAAVEVAAPGAERDEVFYAAWVAYEARTKCTGTGVDGPAPPATVRAWPLEVGGGYAAALALDTARAGTTEPNLGLGTWER